jgi:hypothetical protein
MKEKRVAILLCVFLIALLMGCETAYQTKSTSYNSPRTQKVANARYNITMTAADKSVGSKQNLEGQRIESVVEEGITKYRTDDYMLRIDWRATSFGVVFTIKNKTNEPVKVVWDEARFLDEQGRSHRVIHTGIGYEERNLPQPGTVILGGMNLQDFIYPLDYFQWEVIRGTRSDKQQGYGDRKPFLPTKIKGSAEELREKAEVLVGKTFQAALPLEISNVRTDYLCTFKITNVDVTEGEEPLERNPSEKRGNERTGKRRPF